MLVSHRQYKVFVVVSVILPGFGVLAAAVLASRGLLQRSDIYALGIMYVVGGIGITTGYHRLLTHRAFKTGRLVKVALTTAGAMAAQGPPLTWAAHHRRHHLSADRPGDPHSPHLSAGSSFRGLLHAHLGWLLAKDLNSDPLKYCPDLVRDRDLRRISKNFLPIVLLGIVLPGFIDLAFSGTLAGFLGGLLWGGLVRIFLGNHVTFAVNSLGHYVGRREFDVEDESRNATWLAILSLGEGWHNNHHAFPRSYRFGLRWYQLDIGAAPILGLERIGLAQELVRIDPARISRKKASRTASRSTPPGGEHTNTPVRTDTESQSVSS